VVAVDAFLLALEGRAGDAASLVERFGDDENSPVHERMDLLVARLQGAYERDDLGAAFEQLAASYDGLGLRWFDPLPTQAAYFVWLAYGRLERARRATGDERATEILAARRAIATLRKLARRTILSTSLESPGGDHGWVLLGAPGDSSVSLLDGSILPMQPALASLLGVRSPRLGGGPWTRLLRSASPAPSGEVASWLVMPLETRDGPACWCSPRRPPTRGPTPISAWWRVRPGSWAAMAARNSPCCCPESPHRPMPWARLCGRPWPTSRSTPGEAR
jgi:PAS domain-containing protein